MNSFETITFTEVRERAKAKMRELNTTSQDMYIDLSILDANRRIQSVENTIQKCATLDVCDSIADLPCDYKDFILMFTAPQGESQLPMVYTDYPLDAPQGYTLSEWGNKFLIQQGKLKFKSNFDSEQVVLYYTAYNTDDNGFPLLKLSHVDYYVWSVIGENFEAVGDYKSATYWKSKASMNKKALIHNEQVTQLELDKVEMKAVILRLGAQYVLNNGFSLNWRY